MAARRPAGRPLQAHLSVAVLGGADVPGAAVAGDPAGAYGPLLDRAEAGHDLVLLTGGLALHEPWTKFCLQQADRILAVTAGGPVPPELSQYPELHGCDLVAYDAAPGALAGWAAALDPAGSHLIRETELGADIARIARRLAGTSVGIVLSGGGARAFSHIGVLEELTAAGVTIDRIAGVSMGAVIGALFAMGHDTSAQQKGNHDGQDGHPSPSAGCHGWYRRDLPQPVRLVQSGLRRADLPVGGAQPAGALRIAA